jgi:O-antigen/teichoic acid export membrane protein
LAVAVQRLFAFVSTALAARVGGVAILGEYSLALSTAGMVGTFVGTGVGTVALRYVGQFPRTTQAYRKVLGLVALITVAAAAASGLLLLLGSKPLARLALNNAKLSVSLQFAAAALVILVVLEALNGTLVALHDFRSLLWLSVISGVIMVFIVPYSSQFGAKPMLICYAVALGTGIAVALFKARTAIRPLAWDGSPEASAPRAREIILFGNTQQFNTIVIAVASWWVILLVTRQDSTLHQMGYYFVGSQLRQVAGQAPTLASQLVFPTLSRLTSVPKQHDRVLSMATFLCAALSFVPAGVMLIGLPWILRLYGLAFREALVTGLILIATAVIQLTYFPVANALMMLSLRAAALLNALWSCVLALLAYALVSDHGAVGAALAWLLSQVVSQVVLFTLMVRMGRLPTGTLTTWCLADLAVLSLTGLAFLRALKPNLTLGLTAVQVFAFVTFTLAFLKIAQARDYLPRGTRELLLILRSAPSIVFGSLFSPRRIES